ncbi:MAG: HEAT repeat domain-containing protein [Planctomycetota bacterium]
MKILLGSGAVLVLGALVLSIRPAAENAAGAQVAPPPAAPAAYPQEEISDTSAHSDEALVNVRLAADRWPDCTTLASAMEDIFRLEGVKDKGDSDKAMALWKWFRVLVSSTGGAYSYEGPRGQERLCGDPHGIFTVYGHHQCDGLSWAMVPLWRAAGYIAFDECTHGHTIAALRYRDADGQARFHDFDPQSRFYYWNDEKKIVGTWSMPVMRGRVYRHVTAPQKLHSLRTSLRIGETIERAWENKGHIIPHHGAPENGNMDAAKAASERDAYYAHEPGKTRGVYAVVGEEVQTLEACLDPERFAGQLYDGSVNAACSAPKTGRATLHPAAAGKPAELIWRMAPPYVVAAATCEARLVKTDAADLCRLSVSLDGSTWTPIFVKEKTGEETVEIDLGKVARAAGKPDVYTAYNFFIKADFQAAGDVRGVGASALKITAWRQLNKRTLPNLRPGENVLRVTADNPAEGFVLELEVGYTLKGQAREVKRHVRNFPYYFRIDAPDAADTRPKDWNYDQKFNDGDLQMTHVRMRLVPAKDAPASEPSLKEADVLPKFEAAGPHPADYSGEPFKKILKPDRIESDVRQTNGFFPQGDLKPLDDDAAMNTLLKRLKGGSEADWRAVEDLGDYPKALDALLGFLPAANIDQTLFICKGLARQKPARAVKPLLDKWKKKGAGGAPGARYIPDVLAAIGDRSAVPELIAPLPRMRFDFRFHIAHALGILGGPEAEKALADLAANDPFPAVREEAAEALKALRAKP